MSADFAALVGSVAVGVPGVRACLLVDRDGLALAVTPPGEEGAVAEAWGRLDALGNPERGFAAMGTEIWVFCRSEHYGALALADANLRPGVLLDRLEQVVERAEDARARSDALSAAGGDLATMGREAARAGAPRRFRLPLHREEPSAAELEPAVHVVPADPAPAAPQASGSGPGGPAGSREAGGGADPAARARRMPSEPPQAAAWVHAEEPAGDPAVPDGDGAALDPQADAGAPPEARPAREDVDTVAIAWEFQGLLARDGDKDS